MVTVNVQLPEEAFSALRRSPAEMAGDLRLASAVHWYSRGLISQELQSGPDRARNAWIAIRHTRHRIVVAAPAPIALVPAARATLSAPRFNEIAEAALFERATAP